MSHSSSLVLRLEWFQDPGFEESFDARNGKAAGRGGSLIGTDVAETDILEIGLEIHVGNDLIETAGI